MRLFIVRHALAGEAGDPRYPDDSQRPLEKKGRRRFRKLSRHLAKHGVCPEIIATSPYIRCHQTAEILAQSIPDEPELILLDALEPGANLEELLQWTQRQGAQDVAWVGHAPDVGLLCAALIGLSGGAGIRFAKGAIAAIKFADGRPTRGNGELQWLVTEKVLGC